MSAESLPVSSHTQVTDVNVLSTISLPSPGELRDRVSKSEAQAQFVSHSREEIERIIFGDDSRFLVMVDASHANSAKNHENQPKVIDSVIDQIQAGNHSIIGAMIESHLGAGNQKFPQPKSKLEYGVSITDACINWPTTVATLERLYHGMEPRFG